MEEILDKRFKEQSQDKIGMSDSTNGHSKEELEKLIAIDANNKKKSFDGYMRNARIDCYVWLMGENGSRDKLIGHSKKKVGKLDFVVKGKKYFINYDFLREGKKSYEYHCDVRYSNAPLSFHKLADKDARFIIATQADTMLMDGVVKVLMGKGGIPALYLLVAFIVVAIALALTMYMLSTNQSLGKELDATKTLSAKRLDQLNQLQEQGIVIPPPREIQK